MSWARFDDTYSNNPKVIAAGALAELLDMRAIIWCAQQATDGFIGSDILPALAREIPAPKKKADRLVAVGRWRAVDAGWEVVNFLDYNPSRAQRDAERETARVRMARARKSRGSSGEHAENFAGSSDNPVPSRPDPSHSSSSVINTVVRPVPILDDDEMNERAAGVFRAIADRRMKVNGPIKSPGRYRARVLASLGEEVDRERLASLLTAYPDAPNDLLAGALEGESSPYLRNYAVNGATA